MAMWSNFMQFVGEEGYVTVEPKKGRSQWLIRATAKGRMARQVWHPLFGVIEKRWEARFRRW